MLTSSHYIHPDYLQPLPTSMDAKNSPLALLAQTCNNIGKDSNNSKSLIPPFEKDKKKDSSSDKCGRESSTSGSGSSSLNNKLDKSDKSSLDSPLAKDIITYKGVDISKRSPPPSLSKRDDELMRSSSHSPKDRDTKSVDRPGSGFSHAERTLHSSNSLLSTTSSSILAAHSNGLFAKSAMDSLYPSPLSLSGYPGLNGYPFTSGLASASTAAILAAHKHNPESVRYTTVRTATGATTLVPICNDPYCMYCKVTLQSAQLATSPSCTAGCVQCTHDKGPAVGLPPSYPSSSLASGLLGMSSLHSLSSAYQNSAAVAAAAAASHSQLPYVCSWIGTGGFCGKRFVNSEDLVTHLRTHTTTLDTPSALTQSGLPLSSLQVAAATGLASHLYPISTMGGSMSPSIAALRQAYPRSLSPTSVFAASRFHPYLKSSLSSLPPGLDSSGLPPVHPSLGAYSSLYSLYGHKLGVP